IQVKLSIDKEIVPKKISYLRVPIALEDKVERKIQEMLETDIIEPVKGPVDWISPMVVVPKGNDDIRICINMRGPNQAIQREHYPLPIIDTLLNKLRGSRIFSKLDITAAYHHVELHPESRDITSFMTNKGYQVKYIPGPTNVSDILSRLCPPSGDKPFDDSTEHFLYAVGDDHVAITLSQIKEDTARDETLKKTDPSWNRDENTKDVDAMRKMKGKIYADKKRGLKVSNILEGDKVRIRNYESGKLEPKWSKEIYKVIKKVGNDTIVVSREGVRYRRPVAHLSKIQTPALSYKPTNVGNKDALVDNNTARITADTSDAGITKRPKREHKLPARYQ
uniref:Reverse transcriptase domain-containing protein n=1 Tax=Anopheles minimus TaxID=112268 RepID=A0A182W823_9DIPT